MLDIQKSAISKLVTVLESVDAQYKIILPDGTEMGELITINRKASTSKNYVPYGLGVTRAYFMPFLDNLAVGGVVEVPFGGFHGATLSSNISAAAVHMWGKGNAMTHKNDATQVVEVMRLG